jgi:hypothetical protein
MTSNFALYEGYPDEEQFLLHVNTFCPFISRKVEQLDENLLTQLSLCTDLVDISCIDKFSETLEFKGNVTSRDLLYLELNKFVAAFMARKQGASHWLNETNLNLYLSQLMIYSADKEASIPVGIRSLMSAISTPRVLSKEKCVQINLWLNVDASISSLHYDGNNNLLVVLSGTKTVCLISPRHTSLLNPGPAYSAAEANHAGIPPDMDTEHYLREKGIPMHVVCVEAGDALFIPEGWWHLVKSCECSLAVNFWFLSTLQPILEQEDMLPYILRAAGLSLTEKSIEKSASISPYYSTGTAAREDSIYSSTQLFELHVSKLLKTITTAPKVVHSLKAQLERTFIQCTLVINIFVRGI